MKAIREALGVTQAGMVAIGGASSEGVVSKRERGEHEPSLKLSEIFAITQALEANGLSWSDFDPRKMPPAGDSVKGK